MVWLILPIALFMLGLGLWLGARAVIAVRLHTYRRLDDLITVVEDVSRLTNDGRIAPEVILYSLYDWREQVRLSDKQRRHERPQQDFT
jgi:hypothetical protein